MSNNIYTLEEFKDEIIEKINHYRSILKVANHYNVKVSELIEFLELNENDFIEQKILVNKFKSIRNIRSQQRDIQRINEINYMIWGDLS
jgi:hypothetical protein